jgi:SAM-dependent methyltransferase
MTFKDHFSGVASNYATFRPHYPEELFKWIATLTDQHDRALDVGTGNGQAATGLAGFFQEVIAVDPSAGQIAAAKPHERVHYHMAPSDATGVEAGTVDLITAAAAAHWFPHDAFHREVRRVARPEAAIVLWTYWRIDVEPSIDDFLLREFHPLVEAFWPPERRYVKEAYRNLPFPFPEIAPPSFTLTTDWSVDHFLGNLRTWSSVQRHVQHHGRDPVAAVEAGLRELWGDRIRTCTWPLAIRAGRIHDR